MSLGAALLVHLSFLKIKTRLYVDQQLTHSQKSPPAIDFKNVVSILTTLYLLQSNLIRLKILKHG